MKKLSLIAWLALSLSAHAEYFPNITKVSISKFNQTNLTTIVEAETTKAIVQDNSPLGRTPGDYVEFEHFYSTGERLNINITYNGERAHVIKAGLEYPEGKTYEELDTSKLFKPINRIGYLEASPLLIQSQKIYMDLLSMKSIPYQDIERILKDSEPEMKKVRAGKKSFWRYLAELGKELRQELKE